MVHANQWDMRRCHAISPGFTGQYYQVLLSGSTHSRLEKARFCSPCNPILSSRGSTRRDRCGVGISRPLRGSAFSCLESGNVKGLLAEALLRPPECGGGSLELIVYYHPPPTNTCAKL